MTSVETFKVIQGHRFWYRSTVRVRLPVSEYSSNLYSISQFPSNRGVLVKMLFLTAGALI